MGYIINKNNINYTETICDTRYEGHTINGKLDGDVYQYSMDMYNPNTLIEVVKYKNGQRTAAYTAHQNLTNPKEYIRHGYYELYNKDGYKSETGTYKNNTCVEKTTYAMNGRQKTSSWKALENGHEEWTFYDNKNRVSESEIVNPNGVRIEHTSYKDGNATKKRRFRPNGTLLSQTTYLSHSQFPNATVMTRYQTDGKTPDTRMTRCPNIGEVRENMTNHSAYCYDSAGCMRGEMTFDDTATPSDKLTTLSDIISGKGNPIRDTEPKTGNPLPPQPEKRQEKRASDVHEDRRYQHFSEEERQQVLERCRRAKKQQHQEQEQTKQNRDLFYHYSQRRSH